jgi:hypothetical protein
VAQARTISGLSTDFEAFLYASIDKGQGGAMPVSVLSALARLDLDPWEEAARLAALPKCNAARRLARILAHLPDASLAQRDVDAVASDLVELLPDHGGTRHYELPDGFISARLIGRRISLLTGVLLGLQWFATSCQPLSQRDVSSTPPATSTAPSLFGGNQ